MKRGALFLLLAWSAACGGEKDRHTGETGSPGGSPETGLPGETGESGQVEDTGDTGGAGDTGGPGGAGPCSEGVPAGSLVTGLSARTHPELESLVYVSWNQRERGRSRVYYSFDEGEWLSTPPTIRAAGEREELLLGIPYGSAVDYCVRLELDGRSYRSAVQSLAVPGLPDGFPEPELLVDEEELRDPTANYLLGSVNAEPSGWGGGDYWKFILDRQGRVVWAWLTPEQHWTLWVRVSRNGEDLLWDEATYWSDWDDGAGSTVHRSKLDGTELAVYATPGLHHAFTELPDGSIVWGAAADSYGDEQLLELRPDGSTRTIWDCGEFHDSIGLWNVCQSNSLYWNESTDSFLYSFYTTSGVVEIDHETGESLRWFGSNYPGAYTFDPPDSAFYWQHGVSYTDAGTLLLSTYRERGNPELVLREYEVDDEAHALRQLWVGGEDEHIEGETNGDAHRLPGGNTLRNFGDGGRVQELTPGGEVVWDVDFGEDHLLGRTVYVEDLYALAP